MSKKLIDSVLELISSLTHYELGSTQFYIIFAVSAVAWLVVARVLMGLLKSDRGIVAALLALVIPLFLGLLAYSLVEVQVVPRMEAEWAEQYLPLGVLLTVVLVVVLLTFKRIILLNGVTGLIIFTFASAAAVGAYFASDVVLETLEKGGEQIKQREERNKKEIDSVL